MNNEQLEEKYREAIQLNPNDAEAHSNLGVILSYLGRYEEAEEEFRKSIQIYPNNTFAQSNLGILLQYLKQYGKAEKEGGLK